MGRQTTKSRPRYRPFVEQLEDRLAPTISITNPGTLSNFDGDVVSRAVQYSNSGSSPSFTLNNAPAGLSINMNTGVITGTISSTAHYVSPMTVTIGLSDMMTFESTSQQFTWNVSQPTVTLTNPGTETAFAGDEVNIGLSASSSAGHGLTYSLTSCMLPDGLSLSSSTGSISGTISTGAVLMSPYSITVTATDSAANVSDSKSFNFVVLARVDVTVWTNGANTGLWSNEGNWSDGRPTAAKVAVFGVQGNIGTNANCAFDNTVQAANRVVAGIRTRGQYTGTLSLTGGFPLSVSSVAGDSTTGFKWGEGADFNHTPNISQDGLNDTLEISGGDETYNVWSGGILNNSANLSQIYINGYATLKATSLTLGLGDNIVIGQDGTTCTLEFAGQTATAGVTNGAVITVSDTTDDGGPNRLIFDGDTSNQGFVSLGLDTSGTSYIENRGTVIRSNSGGYEIALPIRSESGYYVATIDVQSSLTITGAQDFTNTERPVSVDVQSGTLRLGTSSGLTCKGLLMSGGSLEANSESQVAKAVGYAGVLFYFDAGTLTVPVGGAGFGRFSVSGNMVWNGGTFECYVKGNDADERTRLLVAGNLTVGANAHLHLNVVGNLTGGLTWSPVEITTNGSAITGSLTFDNDNWAIAYITQNDIRYKINVTSPN